MNILYPSLKKLCLVMAWLTLVMSASAQSINNYVFSTNNTSSLNRTAGSLIDDVDMNTGTTTLIGGSQNNFTSNPLQNIGFDFYVNGTRTTQFNTTSNGWVGIGNFAIAGQGFLAATGIKLAPLVGATTSIGTSSIGRVHSKVVGAQPNRVLVIEFLRMAIQSNVVNDTNTFQVRLYEATGAIEYVYGQMKVSSGAPLSFNVGFQFTTTAYQHVNTSTHVASTSNSTANTFATTGAMAGLNGPTAGSQRSYSWEPTPINDAGSVTASAITTNSMTLSWNNVANEVGYALYRSSDGGVTYTYVTTTATNITTYNAIGLSANTTYNWRVYSIRESISAPADGVATTSAATKFITIASGNWSDPAIWLGSIVPSAQDSAEISVSHNVVLDAATISSGTLIVKGTLSYWATATQQTFTANGDVIIESGGTFTAGAANYAPPFGNPFRLNIGGSVANANVSGNLIVDGNLDLSGTGTAVQVGFYGTQNATVTGSGTTCELPFILVDKNVVANTIEVFRIYTQPQPNTYFANTQRIGVASGTLKISAAVVTNSFSTNNLQFTSTVNGRLWLNNSGINLGMHPSATVGQMFLIGELRIDAGTMTVGTGSQSHSVTTNGTIRLNGGTLNILGGLQILNINTALLYVEGGRLTIDPQATASLNAFTTAFLVNSSAGFTFTSGSIEILDPHAAAGGTSINIASGGVKIITGGTFIIGNDAAAPSGGVFSTTSGFAINSAYTIPKLVIKNNIQTSASRFCRLLNNLTVSDSLIVATDGYIQTASATVGYTLTVLGHVANNGAIAGVAPATAGTGLGLMSFEGTSQQTVTGTGLAPALSVKIANASGVTFVNSNAWALDLITLQSGNVINNAASLAIGGATYRGDVIIGGLDEATTAGSFLAIPAINTSFGSPNYTYGPAANTLQTGSFNEMPAGAISMGTLTVNDVQGATANRAVSLVFGLNLTQGILNMGNNALTLGTTALNPGTLNRTSGLVQLGLTGSFTRWFAAASAPAFDYALGFPLSNGTSERSMLLSLNGGSLASGGNLTVRHANVIGFTDISPTFIEGTTTINRRTNTYWKLSSTATPDIGTGNTLSIRAIGAGVGAITNVSQLAFVKGNAALNGTHQVGTGTVTIPETNRDFSQANVLGGAIFDTLYIGTNSGVNPLSPTIIAIATGNWNNTATWENGIIPTISNSATIATGVNVTIPTGYTAVCNGLSISTGATLTASAGTLNNGGSIINDGTMAVSGATVNIVSSANNGITINTGGVLTVSSGTVNIGTTGGSNRTLLVDNGASLTVTGGTLNINGNFAINNGSAFNQSGGDINVDGNSGTAATSTAQGTHLVSINTTALNCSAGNLTIIDPPHSTITAGTTNSIRIQVSTGSLTAFSGTHAVRFGNGTSAEIGNTNGFVINTRNTAGIMPLQNVVVNAGSASGRWVSTSYTSGTGSHIEGNLTINTGCEFRHTSAAIFAVGGDIVNNGTLTCASPLIMGGNGYIINNAQAIGGAGTFRNSITTSTGAFTNLTIDNGNSLTLSSNNLTFGVSGVLALGALKVITNNNTIALTSTGSLTRTSGYVVGNLGKFVALGSSVARTFEIGTATDYLPVTVTYPSVTTAGTIALGITTGEHPQIATSCINPAKSVNMNWKLANTGTVTTGGNYTFNFTTGQVDAGTLLSSAKLFVYDGSAWKVGSTGTSTTTSFTVNGLNTYGDVAMGEITPVPATVTIAASATSICAGTNVTFTATLTNGGDAPTYQWKLNGVNTVTTSTYASSTLANNDVVTCAIVSNSACVSVTNATSNTITMVVSPLTVGGTVTGGTTVCSGSNSGLLTLAGHTGAVTKWQSATNVAFTGATDIVNTATTYTSGALTVNTYFRAVVQSGACAASNSASTLVTIDAPSVAGSIAGTSTVCSGSPAGNLTLSGHVGSVVRWESAVSPFAVFSPIANTTTTQSAGSPTQTTHYRAVVKNGSCAEATTTAFIITVTPASVGGTVASNQTICLGGTVSALTLSGNVGSVTKWQSANNVAFTGAIDIANTTPTLTPTGVTTTTYYRAVVTSGGCAPANSLSALITVNPAPVGGTVSGTASVCSGTSPGTLTLSGHSGTIANWQSNNGGGWIAITNTTTTYNPGNLTTTTRFRAILTSGSCTPDTSVAHIVTVSPASAGGTVASNQTICLGGTVSALTLSGNVGSVTKWQSASDALFTTPTDIANTTNTLTPTGVTTTTYYRAVVTSGGCAPANSSSVLITVTPASAGGSVSSNQTICSGGTVAALTLSGNVGSVTKWQSANDALFTTPTDIANTTNTLTPTGVTTTTYYRAVVTNGTCAPANSSSVLITVNPVSVGGSVSSNQTICSGSSVAALNLTGNVGSVTKWQSASDALFTTPTDIANTTNTLTPTGVTTTTYYRAVVTSGSCLPANSSSVLITVTPPSAGGSVSSNQTICSGGTVAALTLTGNVGSVTKWQSANNIAFTGATDIANTTTTLTPTGVTTTTYYRAVVTNGTCAPANSSAALITVTPASVGGTVASNQTICSGGTVAALTLTGNIGLVTKWQSASDALFTTPTDIANTTTTLTPTGVTINTYYRAVVTSGSCLPANSSSVLITVTPASAGGSVSSNQTICSGGTVAALTLTGNVGSVTKWQSANNIAFTGATDIANTTTTLTPTGVTTTTYYRAVVTNGTCLPANSSAALITVTPASAGGTVASNQTICSGGAVAALTLSGNVGSVTKWQSANDALFTTPTDIANTTNTLTPTGVTTTTYYRAVVTNGTCLPANSSSVLITVNPISVGGSVSSNQSICSGGTVAALNLTGNTGTVTKWQSASDALFTTPTDIANTTATLTPTGLTTTTYFRAVVTSGTCLPANSSSVLITVSPAPVGGTVSGTASVCSGTSPGILTLSGHTGSVANWQSNSGSGWINVANTTTTYTPGNLTITTRFRAVLTAGSCTPDTSIAHTVTVSPVSLGGTVSSNQSICSGGTVAALNLTGNVGSVTKWQSANNIAFTGATDIANTTNTLTPTGVTSTTYYRAVVTSGGCAPANSSSVLITVNPAPVGGTVTGTATVCSGTSPGILTLSGHSGTIANWQSNSGGGWINVANTTTTYNPGNLTITTRFRAILTSGSCTPDTSVAHTVTVSPISVGGTVASNQTICSGGSAAALTLTGNIGSVTKWQSASDALFTTPTDIANTTTTLTPTGVTTTTYYRAVVTNGTCVAANSSSALITVVPPSAGGSVSSNQTICAGGAVAALTLAGNVGSVTKWQSASDALFTTPTDIANTTNTLTPTGVITTTYYRAVVTNGTCLPANSSSVLITVTPAPVGGTVGGTNAVCSNTSPGILTLSGHFGTIANWQSNSGSGWINVANTTTTYNPGNLTITTSFRAILTSGSCTPDTSVALTVTVSPVSVGGTVASNQSICSGGTAAALNLTGNVGLVTKWQSASDVLFTTPTDIANTTTTLTPTGVIANTYYRAVVTIGGCAPVNSSSVLISVSPAPVGGTVSGTAAVCSGTSPGILTLSGHSGTIANWQSNSGGGWINVANTTTTYNPGNLTITTSFRAILSSGSCTPDTSVAHTVTVSPVSVGGAVASNQSICSGATVAALNLTGNIGLVTKWQSANDALFTTPTDIANTTTTLTPIGVTTTTYYRAVVANGTCLAANSSSALITVVPPSAGGVVSSNQTICAGGVVTQLTLSGDTGSVVKWQSASDVLFTTPTDIANTLTTYTPTGLTTSTYYRVVVQNGSCAPANSSPVLITVNPATVAGVVSGTSGICSSGSATLSLTGNVGNVVKWQSAVSPFTVYSDIVNTTSSLVSSGLTQTTRFRAVVQNGTCAIENSNEFEVTVTSSGIWLGAVSTSWNTAGNWCGGVPTATTNVVIPAGTLNNPVIDVLTALANNITVDVGATLSFTGSSNTLDLKGSLIVNGSFNTLGGLVVFSGTNPQSVAGITYDALRMNGTGTKSLTGNALVTGIIDLVSGNLQLGNFNLVIVSIATAGGSASSYIVTNGSGSYTRNALGASARIFAVGTTTSYTPLLIANTGTTDDISVKVAQGIYNAYIGEVGSGAPISANVVNKTFIVNEAIAGGSSLDITFNWNGIDELGINRVQTVAGRHNGGVWSNISGTAAAAAGSNPYNFTVSGVTNLGILGLGDISSPLPVKLIGFTAKLIKGTTKLTWITASEINNSYFDIERSFDGHLFTKVGTLKAKGNSNSRADYAFVDASSLEALKNANVLYYRLKQVDISGKSDYSNVLSVSQFENAIFEVISTVPNPFNDETEITYKTSNISQVDVQITDAFGKLVKTETVTPILGANNYKLQLDDLNASGLYFIKISQDGRSRVVKAIKK